MGRLAAVCAALVVGIATAAPGSGVAAAERKFQPPPGSRPTPPPAVTPAPPRRPPPPAIRPSPKREHHAVHQGWPLRRPPREVIVRPPRHPSPDRVRVRIYLPPLFFGGVVIGGGPYGYRSWDDRYSHDRPYGYPYGHYDYRRPYNRERLIWADSERIYRKDEWVEFTLDCTARGERLWFEVRDGRVQIDWAEIVFTDGEAQVVDFEERSIGPGVYPLLEFQGNRRVDHVRMVAQATTREVQMILRMER